MIGTTLVGIREHIEALADPAGSYYVVCGRTGERPVPASGLRSESREHARNRSLVTDAGTVSASDERQALYATSAASAHK